MLAIAAASLLLAQIGVAPAPSLSDKSGLNGNSVAPTIETSCNCREIPALTPVELVIDADVGSKLSKGGETFPIRLTKPILIGDRELVAAGATGLGEVVHAKKGGGSGAPGELVLAARYLNVGDRRLMLRSLHLSGVGTDKIGAVHNLAVASAASPVPIALIGFMITGGEKTVTRGSVATAKTAARFSFETEKAAGPASPPALSSAQTGGETK